MLAAMAAAERLDPKLEKVADFVAHTFPAVILATRLEQFRSKGGVIGDAVNEGMDELTPPRVIASLRKRSHGLVNDKDIIQTNIGFHGTNTYYIPTAITPARLFLLCHFASMRDRSFALRDEAEQLFGLLGHRCRADISHDIDIASEQRRARLFLGPLALEQGDVEYAGSPIESARVVSPEWDADDPVTMKEIDWAIKVTREISPDWQASERVTMLATRCFQALSELDSRFREVPALGLGFSKGGGDPLLDKATRERWARIVRQRLVEDEQAMLKAVLFRDVEMLPALYQLTEMNKYRRSIFLMKRVHDAVRRISKPTWVAFYMSLRLVTTRIKVIEVSTGVIIKLGLFDAKIREQTIAISKGWEKLKPYAWVMKKPQVKQFTLSTRKPIQVRFGSENHLFEKLESIGTPSLTKAFDYMGRGTDGLFTILSVVDIVQRLIKHEEELDQIQDYAQLLNDFLILLDIGFRRLLKIPKSRLQLAPLIAIVQSMIAFAKAYEALEEGRDKDAAREAITGVLMLMTIPRLLLLVGIGAAVHPYVILGAVLAMVVLPLLLQSDAPEDIKVCVKRLTCHVAQCAFGKDKEGFGKLRKSQPSPDPFPSEKKELEWLDRVETETCDPDLNVADLDRITAAATAIAVESKAVSLLLDQCTGHFDWLNWFGAEGRAAGYRLTIPGAVFLGRQAAGQQAPDTPGRERIFFQREAETDIGILIWLEHSTNGEEIEVVVQTGRRDDEPVCYADTGIGLSLVKREKDTSDMTPPP